MSTRKRSGLDNAVNSPVRKRSKLSKCDDNIRDYVLRQKQKFLISLRSQYHDNLAELSFLQAGSHLTDYFAWRHSRSEQLCDVLRTGALDDDDLEAVNRIAAGGDPTGFYPLPAMAAQNYTISSDFLGADNTKDDIVRFISIKGQGSSHDRNGSDLAELGKFPSLDCELSGPNGIENGNLDSINDESETAQREIVEKARQEATAMQRVAQLRKEGLWSARRLPKVAEPPRRKAHWDYVLEEMQWLAVDFIQERKWKKAAARKIAYAIQKKFKEREDNERRAERDEINRKKRIASSMARMVREWWQNIDKLVQYKQKTRLDEMRKKALDVHLNFIVDQTERFSEWLTEGLHVGAPGKSDGSSGESQSDASDDDDFNPETVELNSEDDEETIARAEEENDSDVAEELNILRQEGEIPIEELMNSLLSRTADGDASGESIESSQSDEDMAVSEDSEDDERTLDEQENHEETVDTKVEEEIAALEEEADLPIEDLLSKYGGIEARKHVVDESDENNESEECESESGNSLSENESMKESSSDETEKAEDSTGMSCDEMGDVDKDDAMDTSLSALLPKSSESKKLSGPASDAPPSEASTIAAETNVSEVERNFNALAAEAESLQPTGYTLESTHINVPVPFLIKHSLREYQHVGLDWLATMYDKRLNGILADEMGLGKTIQTIALLAHLACEKGVWGPHLIVVPTSVMLNWELEFKKWCPSFKILTYFGSQKERKEKRKGWTKTNAFHVCITSYKLAIQDHTVFKRKKWKYLVLDEAQNIKNFKSKRWQTLLTFNSQRRLLLTGTPLQNSLMELWSLMHFLMPHVFQSHREFKEWFANPLTGMIEGSQEYNEFIVKRLHKVLRPFILRRLKKDVEKQMPQKYEHVVMCRLSRRQRFLYDDFMSRASTQNSLSSGHFMSVINILMQLRKVCNHPNLFEPRPTVSPFKTEGIDFTVPSLVLNALDYQPLNEIDIRLLFPSLVEMESNLSSFVAHRIKQLQPPKRLIEEIDSVENIPPKDPYGIGNPAKLPRLSKAFIPREVIKKLRAEQSAQTAQDARLGVNSVPQATPLEQLPGYLPLNRRSHTSKTPDWSQSYRLSNSTSTPPHWENLPSGTLSGRRSLRRSQLQLIAALNERRCDSIPVYGCNLLNRLCFVGQQPVRPLGRVVSLRKATFLSRGFHNAFWAQCQRERTRGRMHWCGCSPLEAIVNRPEDHLRQLDEIVDRFVFCIPPVWSPGVKISAPHLPNEFINWERFEEPLLRQDLSPKFQILNTVARRQTVRFPEVRLIQYDCGKLQTLDPLLRKLKRDSHRVLIFTQMTRMLDVLEQFLSYYGHRYLRLDGTTKVEQRQALMERFNADSRIFCFILSTRSGGLGINLTGADTVIFYDSDWNPTMDAQAQDRCHRIGQTRDVHIYRLISEKTIEENILKKANQKRFLSDVAIEGGKFTTAHFRQNTLKELFAEPSGLEDFVREKNASSDVAGPLDEVGATNNSEAVDSETVERCLEECEDDSDRIAAGKAREEAKAELAEFDENIPWDEQEAANQSQAPDQMSRVELELRALENELSAIERFAVRAIETNQGGHLEEELNEAETRIEQAKRNWELEHVKALRDAEEMRAEEEEDDMLYCYGAYDLSNQCFMRDDPGDIMPIIGPPSPCEEDYYVDDCLALMYETTLMTESQLPNFSLGREKLMYTGLVNTPAPAPGTSAVPNANTSQVAKQHSLVSRDRTGAGHPPVKRRKLISNANIPGGGGPPLMRQGSCGGQAMAAGGAPRPAIGVAGAPPRHYRTVGAGVKGGPGVTTCQAMDRERNSLAAPVVAGAAAGPTSGQVPPSTGAAVGTAATTSVMQPSERLSSTAQAAQLRTLLPRAVFQRDSTGASKMRGRSLPPYPARNRGSLPSMRTPSLGPGLVHPKMHQEWTAHEESALFTSLTQLQDIHFNSTMAERYPCWQVHSANFLLGEFFINTYARPRCFRSQRQISSHYENLQTSFSSGSHAVGPTSASAMLAGGAGGVSGAAGGTVGGLGAAGAQGLHGDSKAAHPGMKIKRKSSVTAAGQHRFRALTTPSGADNPAAAAAMANSAEGKYATWLSVAKTLAKRKRPAGMGPPSAGSSVASTQGIVQRNSQHVAALQENGINPDLLLGPMQIIKAKEEREQRMKEQQCEHPGSSGQTSSTPSILSGPQSAVSSGSFAHPAATAGHKLQAGGPTSQQQRILVAGPAAAAVAGVPGAGGGNNLTALQRRSVIATQPAALTASTLRRSSSANPIASVSSAQNSPRILQRPQGNTVQMASLIRQPQLMTQVAAKRGNANQSGSGQVAGVSASGQPTASARIQALAAATATTVSVGTQPATAQQFRTGISVNTQGAAQARLVTAGNPNVVGHAGASSGGMNPVAAILRAKQGSTAVGGNPTLVKSLSQRIQAAGTVAAGQGGAGPSIGTPVQIIQPSGQRGVQTTVTVQQIQQLIRHNTPSMPHHIISGPQGMAAAAASLRRTGPSSGEHIVISRFPANTQASEVQQGLVGDPNSTGDPSLMDPKKE